MSETAGLSPIRDHIEIQKAHDILAAIALKEVDVIEFSPHMHACLDTLCWVLQHDHNNAFADNLKQIEAIFAERGIECSKAFPL